MGRAVVFLAASIVVVAYVMYAVIHVERDLKDADNIIWLYAKEKYTRAICLLCDFFGIMHPVMASRSIYAKIASFQEDLITDVKILNLEYRCSKEQNKLDVFFRQKISNDVLGGTPVRIYTPLNQVKNGPALIWIHGGGWVTYFAARDDDIVAHLASELDIVIMSIDYRLAPEYPFPIPFDDCFNATLAFITDAAKYDVNPNRIAIGGASAGGNLAAAVSLKFRDNNETHQPSLQILVVPCLQAFDFMTPSYQENEYNTFLPQYWMINFWLWYAKGYKAHNLMTTCSVNQHTSIDAKKANSYVTHDLVARKYRDDSSYSPPQMNHGDSATWRKLEEVFMNPYFAPLMADDLTGLPPAYIITAQYDVLRDDGIMYKRRLEKAGVDATLNNYEGAIHVVLRGFNKYDISKLCMQDLINYMSSNL